MKTSKAKVRNTIFIVMMASTNLRSITTERGPKTDFLLSMKEQKILLFLIPRHNMNLRWRCKIDCEQQNLRSFPSNHTKGPDSIARPTSLINRYCYFLPRKCVFNKKNILPLETNKNDFDQRPHCPCFVHIY